MTEILSQEGLRPEAVDSSYRCIARYVEEPAPLVLVGLSGLEESELELIRTLKREDPSPKILVSFPAALRDRAVRALEAGADAYLLEPFYSTELVQLARSLQRSSMGAGGEQSLLHLAEELAHAVKNPLQVVTLLLSDEKTTKKKLLDALPEQVARIRRVVDLLEGYASVRPAAPRPLDLRPVVENVANKASTPQVTFQVAGPSLEAVADETNLGLAVDSILRAVEERGGKGVFELRLQTLSDRPSLTLEVSRSLFPDENPEMLPDEILVVRQDRTLLGGLARAAALLATFGATLRVETQGEACRFVATLPRTG